MEADFEKIAELLHQVLELSKEVQASHGKMLKDFTRSAAEYSRSRTCLSLVFRPKQQHLCACALLLPVETG